MCERQMAVNSPRDHQAEQLGEEMLCWSTNGTVKGTLVLQTGLSHIIP